MELTTPNDVRKIVLVMTIGLCEALEHKAISINEAAHYLFSPRTMKLMAGDPEVKTMIHMATEFEDLEQLVPTALPEAIAGVKSRALAALEQTPPCDFQQEFWLISLLSK